VSAGKTKSLRDVQVWMVSAITGVRDRTPDASAKDVERYVTAGPRLSAADRFDIYRSGYHARLFECLLDDYPVLAAMLQQLGDDAFDILCRAYVDRHPSASPNLNGFGRHMASFCREGKVEGIPGFDDLRVFASELATLEWSLVEVLHAETAAPLEIAALQALPPEAWARARFITNPALHVFRFEYPVNAVFIANRIEEIVPEVPARSPNAVAVYRKDMQLWRMDLTPAMLGVLEPLLAGKTLGEALEAIEAEVTDPEILAQTGANLMVWFREWVDAGFFTRIELAPDSPEP
jgi:hypothetical protein